MTTKQRVSRFVFVPAHRAVTNRQAIPAYDEAPYYAQQERVSGERADSEAVEIRAVPPEEPSAYWEDSVPVLRRPSA